MLRKSIEDKNGKTHVVSVSPRRAAAEILFEKVLLNLSAAETSIKLEEDGYLFGVKDVDEFVRHYNSYLQRFKRILSGSYADLKEDF